MYARRSCIILCYYLGTEFASFFSFSSYFLATFGYFKGSVSWVVLSTDSTVEAELDVTRHSVPLQNGK